MKRSIVLGAAVLLLAGILTDEAAAQRRGFGGGFARGPGFAGGWRGGGVGWRGGGVGWRGGGWGWRRGWGWPVGAGIAAGLALGAYGAYGYYGGYPYGYGYGSGYDPCLRWNGWGWVNICY
jgi:hypothetical protein